VHEMSVMGEIFSILDDHIKEHKLNKISKIVLRVGEMTCINPKALDFAFQIFAEGTLAEGGELIVKRVEARARCNCCGRLFKISYLNRLCPHCQTYSDQLVNGYELLLDEVEGEIDEGC